MIDKGDYAIAPPACWDGCARHYHRERCAVSLADCVASATAITHDRPLATADLTLAALLSAEHGKIIGLPDTNGQRP